MIPGTLQALTATTCYSYSYFNYGILIVKAKDLFLALSLFVVYITSENFLHLNFQHIAMPQQFSTGVL